MKRLFMLKILALALGITFLPPTHAVVSFPSENGQFGYMTDLYTGGYSPGDAAFKTGEVRVYCIHPDLKGRPWSDY